jgi:hypothetical protein
MGATMNRPGLSIILAASVLLLSGCDKKDYSLPKMGTEAEQQAAQTAGKNGKPESKAETTQAERDKYLQAAREEIDKLTAGIEALKVKAQKSGSELKAKLEQDLKGFQEDLKGSEEKLNRLKNASASAWGEMKNALVASIDKLKNAIRNAANQ